jgi:hypothetical protein
MSKKDAPAQLAFAGVVEPDIDPEAHWKGMPEFTQENLQPVHQIIVSFATDEDVRTFACLIDQPSAVVLRSLWFPGRGRSDAKEWAYVVDADVP